MAELKGWWKVGLMAAKMGFQMVELKAEMKEYLTAALWVEWKVGLKVAPLEVMKAEMKE